MEGQGNIQDHVHQQVPVTSTSGSGVTRQEDLAQVAKFAKMGKGLNRVWSRLKAAVGSAPYISQEAAKAALRQHYVTVTNVTSSQTLMATHVGKTLRELENLPDGDRRALRRLAKAINHCKDLPVALRAEASKLVRGIAFADSNIIVDQLGMVGTATKKEVDRNRQNNNQAWRNLQRSQEVGQADEDR